MEKHPVDDLFKRKLSTLERRPSAGAWQRIEGKQEKKEGRRVFWVWYVAAGITLALASVYVVWMIQANDVQPAVAKVTPAELNSREGGARAADHVDITPPQIAVSVEKLKPLATQKRRLNISTPSKEPAEVPTNDLTIAVIEKEQTEHTPEVVVQQIKSIELQTSESLVAHNKPAVRHENENVSRIIMVNVTSDEDATERPKPSRLTRVFRQLKNARAAERVDWEEVGFDPKEVLARVDNKLKL
jgi:hypothetical protein